MIIGIGGIPASGKTSLMRLLKSKMGKSKTFKFGKLSGEYYTNDVFLLGIYDKELFSGTDRLSMAVQPDAVKFIKYLEENKTNYTIIFEGDRLYNGKFIDEIIKTKYKLYILTAKEEIVEKRHINRQDTQSSTFKKSRYTKVNNLISKYGSKITLLENNTKSDQHKNLELLWQDLKSMK